MFRSRDPKDQFVSIYNEALSRTWEQQLQLSRWMSLGPSLSIYIGPTGPLFYSVHCPHWISVKPFVIDHCLMGSGASSSGQGRCSWGVTWYMKGRSSKWHLWLRGWGHGEVSIHQGIPYSILEVPHVHGFVPPSFLFDTCLLWRFDNLRLNIKT